MKYRRNEDEFNEGRDEFDTAQQYWESFSHGNYKDLAQVALNFLKLPSSSFEKCFMIPCGYQQKYGFEIAEKLIAIKLDVI